jgi:mannonate dehydratase
MKLGLGLYRHMLMRENFQFARQAGATHTVAPLCGLRYEGVNSTDFAVVWA